MFPEGNDVYLKPDSSVSLTVPPRNPKALSQKFPPISISRLSLFSFGLLSWLIFLWSSLLMASDQNSGQSLAVALGRINTPEATQVTSKLEILPIELQRAILEYVSISLGSACNFSC